MELLNQIVEQLIEDLTVIKNQKEPLSALERDTVLQILRESYLNVCKIKIENGETLHEMPLKFSQPEVADPSISDIIVSETIIPQPIAEPFENAEDAEDAVIVKVSETIIAEPFEDAEEAEDAMIVKVPEIIIPQPIAEPLPQNNPQPDLFEPPIPHNPIIAKNPLLQEKEPIEPITAEKRSLNDLLTTHKDDLGSKFQQSKIDDLTKAISLNDKFVYIRELFKNRGEEFSKAIQTLNNCRTIDEAFVELEQLKNHYFWDSSQPAYLSLCELIRRKYF